MVLVASARIRMTQPAPSSVAAVRDYLLDQLTPKDSGDLFAWDGQRIEF